MGNNRATYLIGTMIASVAIVFAFAAIIPAITETPTASTGLNALGHVTLVQYDTDGTPINYIQTDNFVLNARLGDVQAGLFSGTALPNGVYEWIGLCTGNSEAGGTDTVQTDVECGGDAATNEMNTARIDGSTSGSVSGAPLFVNRFQGTLTIANSDDNTTFEEIFLSDQSTRDAGNTFSVASFTPFEVQQGQKVFMKYKIDIDG